MSNYKAWIPNVSGCLSFSNIKGIKIPGRAKCPKTFNHLSDENKNRLYSLQERNLSDSIFASFPFNNSAWFLYLLIARVENQLLENEALVGTIYTYPKQELSSSHLKLIKRFSLPAFSYLEADQLANEWSGSTAIIKIEFKLYRDGCAEFTCQEQNEENRNCFVFESYSFLKDLVHSHKFHQLNDDAIVVSYPVINDTDVRWIERTLRNLHKSVISSYRIAQHPSEIINALGRLSYFESFQSSVDKRLIDNTKIQSKINVLSLKSALESKLQHLVAVDGKKSVFLQFSIPLIFSLLALLIAIAQLLQVPCIEGINFVKNECEISFKIADDSLKLVKMLLKHLSEIAIAIPLTSLVIISLTYSPAIRRWLNNEYGKGFISWIQRVTLVLAVSENQGKLLASIWVIILLITLLGLFYLSLGFVKFHI